MSALNDLSKLTGNANSYLSMKIAEFEDARIELTKAHENQSVAVRALAAVAAEHDAVRYGQELELRAVQALALGRLEAMDAENRSADVEIERHDA